MEAVQGMDFNGYQIGGWECGCGEKYYDGDQAQKILLLNKLKEKAIRSKLGRVRSNLILRVPRDIECALDLTQGEEVTLQVEDDGLKVVVG